MRWKRFYNVDTIQENIPLKYGPNKPFYVLYEDTL